MDYKKLYLILQKQFVEVLDEFQFVTSHTWIYLLLIGL